MRRRKITSSQVYTRHGKRNGRHIGLAPLDHLSVAARDSKLNIRAIDWMGYQPSLNATWLRHCRTTIRFGKRWVRLWRTSRKRKAALETEMDRDRAAKRVAREERL